MWGKIIIPMYRLWLNGLYGLYGPRCPLSSKRPINLISLSLSLWSSYAIWRNKSLSTLAQVMACCLTAPSHHLNHCWLTISVVLWHSPEGHYAWKAQDIYPWHEFENDWFKITLVSPRGQWVKHTGMVVIQSAFISKEYFWIQNHNTLLLRHVISVHWSISH